MTKNLMNGTNSMKGEKMGLTGKEIVSIIQTCANTSISKLEFGSLKLEFGSKEIPITTNNNRSNETEPKTNPSQAVDQFFDADKEFQRELNLITDPEAYEREMMGLNDEKA